MDERYFEEVNKSILECCGEHVGIFIDFDNIYHGYKDFCITFDDEKYDIITTLWDIYKRDRIRTIRAYADFDQIDVKLRDLQKNRVQIRQVYGNGLGEKNRKNASDIELSIEAVETYYNQPDI